MNPSNARCFAICSSTALLFVLAVVQLTHAAEPFYLGDSDRVVFYGDSITEQAYYTHPIELFVATRYPHWRMRFINSGWGGDRAWGGEGGTLDQRLQRDVIRYKPTVVTVMLGMNDGYYTNFDEKALDVFRKSIEELIATLEHQLPRVRITLIGISPYDNITPGEQPEWEKIIDGGYDSVVARYSKAMGEIAKEHDLLFVDMHAPLVQLLKQLQSENPELARELIPDRIHPGKAAGLVMAAELLKAWHAPAIEDLPPIDAKNMEDDPLIIHQKWPARFPLNDRDALTSHLFKHQESLNLFAPPRLRITDLGPGKVSLRIDDKDLGVISAEELEAGVELSEQRLPDESADTLTKLIELRNRLHFLKWRTLELAVKPQTEEIKRAVTELAAVGQELTELQSRLARPAEHVIEIRRVEP